MDELSAFVPTARADEVVVVRDALRDHADKVTALWPRLADAVPSTRLHFAALLAGYLPADDRWQPHAAGPGWPTRPAQPAGIGRLVAGPGTAAQAADAGLARLLREDAGPAQERGPGDAGAGRSATQFDLAATLLARYAADQPAVLAELLQTADARHYAAFLGPARGHKATVTAAMRAVQGPLAPPARPPWPDVTPDPSWRAPAAEVAQVIEAADGMLAECFAFVQTVPLGELAALNDALRPAGYRPDDICPYVAARCRPRRGPVGPRRPAGPPVLDLTADAVRQRDEDHRRERFLPRSVASYDPPGAAGDAATRYTAVWVRAAADGDDARLYVGVPAPRHAADGWRPLQQAGFHPLAWHGRLGSDGVPQFDGVMAKAMPPPSDYSAADAADAAAVRANDAGMVAVDLGLYPAPPPADRDHQRRAALAAAEQAVLRQAGRSCALLARGRARLAVGDAAGALADLGAVAAKAPATGEVLQSAPGPGAARPGRRRPGRPGPLREAERERQHQGLPRRRGGGLPRRRCGRPGSARSRRGRPCRR